MTLRNYGSVRLSIFLNLKNGILDVETKELLPHNPAFRSPIQIPVVYDPEAECPTWEICITQWFPEDATEVAWEIPAWLMLPDTSLQKSMLLQGEGGNGKSTYLTGVRNFIGPENTTAMSLQKIEMNSFAAARLVGKLANICPDLPSTHLENVSMFKAITTGEPISAEYKHKDGFDFPPYSRLIFSANNFPHSHDSSEGFFRRWEVVLFANVFEDLDAAKADELEAQLSAPSELSGVLNKALAALPRLRDRGFSRSASMRMAHDAFRQSTDPLAVWLEHNTIEGSDMKVPKQDLIKAFNAAAYRQGLETKTEKAFTMALKKLKPRIQSSQRTIGGKLSHCWLGIELVDFEAEK